MPSVGARSIQCVTPLLTPTFDTPGDVTSAWARSVAVGPSDTACQHQHQWSAARALTGSSSDSSSSDREQRTELAARARWAHRMSSVRMLHRSSQRCQKRHRSPVHGSTPSSDTEFIHAQFIHYNAMYTEYRMHLSYMYKLPRSHNMPRGTSVSQLSIM